MMAETIDLPTAHMIDEIDARLFAFYPVIEAEDVRQRRKQLMQSSLRAMTRLSHNDFLSDEAVELERLIQAIAARYTYRLGDPEGVKDAAHLCIRLRMCANQLAGLDRACAG